MADQISANQSQAQSQSTSLLVSIEGSSDPGLERRIFGEIASAGRQLGRLSDVLEVLVTAYERNLANSVEPSATATFTAFRQMRSQIEREKAQRTPERIIEALEKLRGEDSAAFVALVGRLRSWLDNQS